MEEKGEENWERIVEAAHSFAQLLFRIIIISVGTEIILSFKLERKIY